MSPRTITEHRRAWRLLFAAYAVALVTATHWPRLGVPGGIENSDKVAHFGAFALWTLLATAAGLFGPALTRPNATKTMLLALAYALIDETTQLIPALDRQASLADAAADALGILSAYALARMVIRTC